MRFVDRIGSLLKEVKLELKKVSWSNRQELVDSTILVIFSVALLAAFIGIVDFVLSWVMRLII
jgi:preprotein translocase subunit SecE